MLRLDLAQLLLRRLVLCLGAQLHPVEQAVPLAVEPAVKTVVLDFFSSSPPMALIFFRVTKNRMLVTPAPTAASVMARSGDSSSIQIMDITRL